MKPLYLHYLFILLLAFFHSSSVADESRLCQSYSGTLDNSDKAGLVRINGGSFIMGSNRHHPEERAEHAVTVSGFWIDRHEVTNRQFSRFVEATSYIAVAERQLRAEDYPGAAKALLVPGSIVFIPPTHFDEGGSILQWWHYIPGANWRHPSGPNSTIDNRQNHPVVHIAYEDAQAYAQWRGRELPTEAQWEYAARGGSLKNASQTDRIQGDQRQADGHWVANTWQGLFPLKNSAKDGYQATAPVGCFPPNVYGLFDMIGNVWELTTDVYTSRHIPRDKIKLDITSTVATALPGRVIKGGSFLCAPNFCARYRPSARQSQEVDSGSSHIGFRTVLNLTTSTGKK